ncbi:hypothetical protein Aduo_002090 [Ancylostoma duodenale]
MGNAATTQSQSRKDYHQQGSAGIATVYSNGRAAAAASERSEWSGVVCMLPSLVGVPSLLYVCLCCVLHARAARAFVNSCASNYLLPFCSLISPMKGK